MVPAGAGSGRGAAGVKITRGIGHEFVAAAGRSRNGRLGLHARRDARIWRDRPSCRRRDRSRGLHDRPHGQRISCPMRMRGCLAPSSISSPLHLPASDRPRLDPYIPLEGYRIKEATMREAAKRTVLDAAQADRGPGRRAYPHGRRRSLLRGRPDPDPCRTRRLHKVEEQIFAIMSRIAWRMPSRPAMCSSSSKKSRN